MLQTFAAHSTRALLAVSVLTTSSAMASYSLNKLASFGHADPEINAYNIGTQRTFVTLAGSASLDVLNPNLTLNSSINVSASVPTIGEINSVATFGNLVAVAGKNKVGTSPGSVAFYDAKTLGFLGSVTAGANPDMLTFASGGTKVLVANEGEPNDDYTIDPVGSVSIIDLSGGIGGASVSTASFAGFNGSEATINASGGRVFGPGATAEQDFEPEYIAVSQDGTKAYVSLQENNAIATVDIASSTVSGIFYLGYKDHSKPGNGFDASNKDSINGNIQNHPTLGMYQPDAIATYNVAGTNYIVSANEGDARDYDGYSEETRVAGLALDLNDNGINDDLEDNGLLDDSLAIYDDKAILGRLKTTTATGDIDGDGLIEQIYSYGARSFSIWNADNGTLVFDSGDAFEQEIIANFPGEWTDKRSDDKGPEPEAVALGEVDGKVLAFIGLERTGGIMIYDVTDPNSPVYQGFADASSTGITSPEGITFVSASDSAFGVDTLLVSNEAGGVTETQAFAIVPEPTSLALVGIGGLLMARRRRG